MSIEMKRMFERAFGVSRLDSKSMKYIERFGLSINEIERTHSAFALKFGDFQSPDFRNTSKLGGKAIIVDGGVLLEEEEFQRIKRIAICSGDDSFYIIELNYNTDKICFGFKYPIEVEWPEIANDSLVAEDVYERPIRDFVVFGPSLTWFKLALNDEEVPVNIWHMDKEISSVVKW